MLWKSELDPVLFIPVCHLTVFSDLSNNLLFSACEWCLPGAATDRTQWLAKERVKRMRAVVFALGESVRAAVLQVWSPDQQNQRHLETCSKSKILGPTQFH